MKFIDTIKDRKWRETRGRLDCRKKKKEKPLADDVLLLSDVDMLLRHYKKGLLSVEEALRMIRDKTRLYRII